MNTSTLNSSSFNATSGGGVKSAKYSVDARIAIEKSASCSVDGLLMGAYSVNCGIDAVLQGGSTLFCSVNAVLVTPFKDLGAFYSSIGNGVSVPIDSNKISSWSTYSRPQNPTLNQIGVNTQTGKIEYWSGDSWKNYDNTNA